MKNNNQLKIGVILSYVSTGINMLIQLIYTPIMIQLLGQSEYGLYTLVGSVVSYLSLFSLGFSGAYLRFYSRYKKEENQDGIARLNGMFLLLFIGMAILALVCGMTLTQFTPQIFGTKLTMNELAKAKILMQILVVNIALTFPASVFDSIVTAHEQYLFQRLLSLAGILFNPFLCVPLLLMGYGSVAVVSVTTIITMAKLGVGVWFCLKKLQVSFAFRRLESALLREMAGFSFFIFLNMIIDQINWAVDKFILGRVVGTAAVAVYGVGSTINTLVTQFSSVISSVFSPRVNRIAAEEDSHMKQQFTNLFIKVGRIQFLVLMLQESGIVIFGRYFITDIYATPDYEEAYWVALLLIISAMIPLIQNVGIEIQQAVNKHKFRSIVYTIMALINIGTSIPLAMRYGPIGSALGTAISLLVANGFIMNIYYHKAIGINMIKFWKSILQLAKGMVIPAILGVIIIKCIPIDNIIVFAAGVILYTIVYCVSFWCIGMNQEEKALVKEPVNKFMSKRKSTWGNNKW